MNDKAFYILMLLVMIAIGGALSLFFEIGPLTVEPDIVQTDILEQ